MGFYPVLFCLLSMVTSGYCLCIAETKPRYAMKAKLTQDTTPGANGKIIFDQILIEEGEPSYDNSTGIFTAPIDGMYMLSLKICTHAYWDDAVIVKDSKYIVHPMANHWGCGFDSAGVSLKSGEQVWAQWWRGHATGGGTIRAYHGVYFSAVLVV